MSGVFWFEILLLFCLSYPNFCLSQAINCTLLQNEVPRPQLKYMLSGQLHVIWREKIAAGFNYEAHSCHTSTMPSLNIAYRSSCPQFQAISSCSVTRDSNTSIHQCTMQVSKYVEYTVYLSGYHPNCRLRGEQVKIKPSLRIAYPAPVPKLDVYGQRDGLIIAWIKAFRYVHLLYSIRCNKLGTTASSPYSCCVRVYLPYRISPHFSEVCKNSQNKVITPTFHCGDTYECKNAQVDNLNSFAGHLMPDDSSWPDSPPAMVLEVKKRKI